MARRTCECGECAKCKHREYMNAWYRRPGSAERVRKWAKRYRTKNLGVVQAYDRARGRRPSTPEKEHARAVINHEIFHGRLKRPDICQKCGAIPGEGSDGRTLIQAHHPDYSKPLEVLWLCVSCHGEEHRVIS